MSLKEKSADLRDAVIHELRRDEHLLWVDKPGLSRLVQREFMTPHVAMGVLSILVIAFVFLWFPIIIYPIWIMLLFPLIYVGAYFWQPLWEVFKGATSTYAITDQRLIIVTHNPLMHAVSSYGERDIEKLERRTQPDGSGDLIFASEQRRNWSSRSWWHKRTVDVGFFGVENVRLVEELVQDTFRSTSPLYDALDEDDSYDAWADFDERKRKSSR